MQLTQEFKVGDTVRWSSQAGGHHKEKEGVVIEVVGEMKKPSVVRNVRFLKTLGRDHVSYLIRSKAVVYWPKAQYLELVSAHVAPTEVKTLDMSVLEAQN